MKIDTDALLSVEELAAEIGSSLRAAYRAVSRATEDGHDVTVKVFGKRLIKRKLIETIRGYYYPYYSEAHQAMVKEWGRRGGTQKGINLKKAARSAEREAGAAKRDGQRSA